MVGEEQETEREIIIYLIRFLRTDVWTPLRVRKFRRFQHKPWVAQYAIHLHIFGIRSLVDEGDVT